jgi:carbonic anhydrase
MDARISVKDIFGLRPGDANIIRNAGAVASDDAIRSLVISTQLLGTTGIVVMGHTRCGLLDLDEADLTSRLERMTGASADIGFGSFGDLTEHVRRQVARVREQQWIAAQDVRGLIYEVETGRVTEVA